MDLLDKMITLLKIPVLSELKNLFPEDATPFFAGFGNRDTDGVAYRYLNIPLNNIFLIDTSSKVLRLGEKQKSTYKSIADKVEEIFPLIEN